MKSISKGYIAALSVYCIGFVLYAVNYISEISSAILNFTVADPIAFWRYFLNIVIIGLPVLVVDIIVILLNIKAFSGDKNGKTKALKVLLCISFAFSLFSVFNGTTLSIPQYLIYTKLALFDIVFTYLKPIILSGAPFRLVACVWLFILNLRKEK